MSIEIKVPSLGDGVETADVLEILVSEGDAIEKDQGIVELETDKATAVVPSTDAGTVTKVHVGEGDTVPVGAVLLTVESTSAATTPPASAPEPTPAAAEVAPEPVAATPAPEPPAPPVTPAPPAQVAAPANPPVEPAPIVAPPAPATPLYSAARGGEIPAGPAMRRFAREVGVDLSQVQGSGESGRITRDDILLVVRSGSAKTNGAVGGERDEFGPVRREKMSRMRRTIAEQMHRSWSTVPRVTNFDDADVSDLDNIRKSSKADYAARGIKLTSMPFVIKAVAMALRDHPVINASLDPNGTHAIYKEYVNVGIAVDTDRGLVVPSLRNADELSIPEIAKQLGEVADKVRDNNFTVEDLQGSTFTISNLGAIGGTYSTPIINVPETAILLIGRSRKMPIVMDDKIVARLMMPLSISYDHRLVDGGAAARFLNDLIAYLEAPSRLLLAP
ncbi:MAG: dihydrolipoamide acetyltransferase family protein [Pirellulaceae bacterium]|nr:dihydrolipoamide acetyltransferase family protein [Pirellulaceae bacterium]MDG2105028.1 dihydrolipoamide acetyltransferase family protein [Pirellulaceae bacterium]